MSIKVMLHYSKLLFYNRDLFQLMLQSGELIEACTSNQELERLDTYFAILERMYKKDSFYPSFEVMITCMVKKKTAQLSKAA